MRNDVDYIINILKKYSTSDTETPEELGEDEASSSSGSKPAYPTVTKWETGLIRSVANQIDYKAKWKDLNKITRGKSNTLL